MWFIHLVEFALYSGSIQDNLQEDTGIFTGSIDLYMKPAIGNKGFFNISTMFNDGQIVPNRSFESDHTALVQHYWPGGTIYEPFYD